MLCEAMLCSHEAIFCETVLRLDCETVFCEAVICEAVFCETVFCMPMLCEALNYGRDGREQRISGEGCSYESVSQSHH